MKKMIPVYVILLAMLGTLMFVGYKALGKMDSINRQLASIHRDQANTLTEHYRIFRRNV